MFLSEHVARRVEPVRATIEGPSTDIHLVRRCPVTICFDVYDLGGLVLLKEKKPRYHLVAVVHGSIDKVIRTHKRINMHLSQQHVPLAIEEQIIAANVDIVWIVSSMDNDFNIQRIERYLTLVLESGAKPVVILNKADLCKDINKKIEEVRKISSFLSDSRIDMSGEPDMLLPEDREIFMFYYSLI